MNKQWGIIRYGILGCIIGALFFPSVWALCWLMVNGGEFVRAAL